MNRGGEATRSGRQAVQHHATFGSTALNGSLERKLYMWVPVSVSVCVCVCVCDFRHDNVLCLRGDTVNQLGHQCVQLPVSVQHAPAHRAAAV